MTFSKLINGRVKWGKTVYLFVIFPAYKKSNEQNNLLFFKSLLNFQNFT